MKTQKNSRIIGTLLWFSPEKGFGEIACSLGRRFYFLAEDLSHLNYQDLQLGSMYSFEESSRTIFSKAAASNVRCHIAKAKRPARIPSKAKIQGELSL